MPKKNVDNQEDINELVDSSGARIKGSQHVDQNNSMSKSKETTDDHARSVSQGRSRYLYRAFYGEDDLTTHPMYDVYDKSASASDFMKKASKDYSKEEIADAVKKFYGKDKPKKKETKPIKEYSSDKMKKVLEDIISNKSYDREVIDSVRHRNGIPKLEDIKDNHPVLVRKVGHIVDLMSKDEISGEEKAVMLNAILSMNLVDVPPVYKKELSRKLG